MQGHPLIKIGPTALALKLSVPTITGALESLAKLKIAKEVTGKRRDRLFAYPRYLHILSEGTDRSRIIDVDHSRQAVKQSNGVRLLSYVGTECQFV